MGRIRSERKEFRGLLALCVAGWPSARHGWEKIVTNFVLALTVAGAVLGMAARAFGLGRRRRG